MRAGPLHFSASACGLQLQRHNVQSLLATDLLFNSEVDEMVQRYPSLVSEFPGLGDCGRNDSNRKLLEVRATRKCHRKRPMYDIKMLQCNIHDIRSSGM